MRNKNIFALFAILLFSLNFFACTDDSDDAMICQYPDGDSENTDGDTEQGESEIEAETGEIETDVEVAENEDGDSEMENETEEQETAPAFDFCDDCFYGENLLYTGEGVAFTPQSIDADGVNGDGLWRTGEISAQETLLNWGFKDGDLLFGFGDLSKLTQVYLESKYINPKEITESSTLYFDGPFDTEEEYPASVGDVFIFLLQDNNRGSLYSMAINILEMENDRIYVEWVLNPNAGELTIIDYLR